MNNKKEKLDIEGVNEVVKTGSKILNLFYVVMVFLIIMGVIFLCKILNIFPILFTILSVVSPFFLGFIIAWLLNPIVNKLTDKGMRRGWAVALVYLMLVVLIYLFCLAIIPALVDQLNEMAKTAPELLLNVKDLINNIFVKLSNGTNIDMTNVKMQFMNYLEDFSNNLTTDLPSKIVSIVQGLISGVGKFLVGAVIGFYLLMNFNNVTKFLINMVPKKFKGDVEKLSNNISEVLFGFVNGTFLDSLILLIINIIGFSLIGLNAPVLFAVFCVVTNIIPYVGPYIGGIPAILVGFTQSPLIGTLILVFIVATQSIEGNFLHPIIMGRKMDLHPVTIVISLLIFEHFFGIMGMVVATPVVAVLKVIYVFLDEKFDFFGYSKEKSVKKEISKVSNAK